MSRYRGLFSFRALLLHHSFAEVSCTAPDNHVRER